MGVAVPLCSKWSVAARKQGLATPFLPTLFTRLLLLLVRLFLLDDVESEPPPASPPLP